MNIIAFGLSRACYSTTLGAPNLLGAKTPHATSVSLALGDGPLMPQTEAVNRVIEVVGAVILAEGRVLCVQRGPDGSLPGMWEFPGGKVEPGETPRKALEREIEEELECRVRVGDEVAATRHGYDFGVVHLQTFYCELTGGTPHLIEHSQLVWSDPRDLGGLDWAPADLPAVAAIEQRFNNSA